MSKTFKKNRLRNSDNFGNKSLDDYRDERVTERYQERRLKDVINKAIISNRLDDL